MLSPDPDAVGRAAQLQMPRVSGVTLRLTVQRILARLPVYVADLREDPKWLLMFLFARLVIVRKALAFLASRSARRSHHEEPVAASALFGGVDAGVAAEAIERNGLYRGFQLPADLVDGLVKFADQTPCYGDFDRALSFLPRDYRVTQAATGRPILVGHYLDRLDDCPQALAVRRDPLLRDVAMRYLRTSPIVISSRMWWSFPSENCDDAALKLASQERFHFDLNDWRSLKFFFYLTDVDDEAGAHVYVRGSHRKRRLSHQFTAFVGKSHRDILAFYGQEQIVRIHGRAGHGFAEDPFGFHMGTLARSRPRLMFEVEYGVTPPTPRRYYGDQDLRERPAT